MSNIIGRPFYDFYNLHPSDRQDAAQELFDASLAPDSPYKIALFQPQDERFYYVISEKKEDGSFVETSRSPSEWAAGLAVKAAWGQDKPEHERPNAFDIESMGAHFEIIALRHFVALERDAETGVQP